MRSILALAIISFGFVSCGAPKTHYVYLPCPKLQLYELNVTEDVPFALHYEVQK